MRYGRLGKAFREEFGPWADARGKKPLLTQAQEAVALWRHYGALPTQYLRAQLYLADRGTDLSGFMPFELVEREQALGLTPEVSRLLDDKLAFSRHMTSAGLAIPAILLARVAGTLTDGNGDAVDRPAADASLAAAGALIVKPVAGHYGAGIAKIDGSDAAARDALFARQGDFLVQPFLKQHPTLSALYPQAVNTVRLATWMANGVPQTIAAALKIGIGGQVVDNIGGAGGLVVGIDPATGTLFDKAWQASKFSTGPLLRHPDTGAAFAGVALPFWPETVALAQAAARAMPEAVSVGWDIALTVDGPVVIEGNRHWSGTLFQLAGIPLAPTAIGRAALARGRGH